MEKRRIGHFAGWKMTYTPKINHNYEEICKSDASSC